MDESGNPFVWYDLMTPEPAAAAAFYSDVVGWSARDSGMPDMNYTLLSAGDAMVAGLSGGMEGMPSQPTWMGHVYVVDVDSAASEIVALGGAICRDASDIPGIGRFAVAADPSGAVFIIFHPAGMPPQSEGPTGNLPGHVGWHELHSGDAAVAWPFYRKLFGWVDTGVMEMGSMGGYQMFAAAGEPIGGMMNKSDDGARPFWQYYFNVAALDAAAAKVTAGGGRLLHDPREVPGGMWVVNCLDPQGATFAIVAPAR